MFILVQKNLKSMHMEDLLTAHGKCLLGEKIHGFQNFLHQGKLMLFNSFFL